MKTTQQRTRALPSLLFILLASTAFLFLPACGDDSNDSPQNSSENKPGSGSEPKRNDGETACGENTCTPGTFCENQHFSVCEPGCTSDLNCISTTHRCEINDVFTARGVCARLPDTGTPDTGTPDTGTPGTPADSDLVKGCLAYCTYAHTCELVDASQLAGCNYICRNEATPVEIQMIVDCQQATNSCAQFAAECMPEDE